MLAEGNAGGEVLSIQLCLTKKVPKVILCYVKRIGITMLHVFTFLDPIIRLLSEYFLKYSTMCLSYILGKGMTPLYVEF